MNKLKFSLLLLALSILAISCNDDQGNSRLIISLTDSPGDYKAVNVDIQSIEIHRSTGNQESGWISLDGVNAAVYNLLDLTNGIDVVLADTEFPTGQLSQMRLVLGDNNTVDVDGQILHLETPSALQSGLKLQINQTLEKGITYQFLLDFDAAKSVVKAGSSGQFNLKPVIKVRTEATSGAIKGFVMPEGINVAVYAMQGADTIATTYAVEDISEYLLGSLDPGSYDVVFDPGEMSGYLSSTIEDVEVLIGEITNAGETTLVKGP